MILPNFLIIGAAKAGTTTLFDHLRAHPEVFMPAIKEPKFFAYRGRGGELKFPVKTLEDYAGLFAGAGEARAIGEASPHYLYVPGCAERIAAAIPEARIVAILRDPVERAHSIYQMNIRNRGTYEGLDFATAFARDPALRRGYHDDLATYYARFPRERIRILLFDDLVRDTRGVIGDLLAFLGARPDLAPALPPVSNPGGLPRRKRLHALLNHRKLRAFGRAYVPAPLLATARHLRNLNLEKHRLTAEDRALALPAFAEDIRRTGELVGRDLSAWLAPARARPEPRAGQGAAS